MPITHTPAKQVIAPQDSVKVIDVLYPTPANYPGKSDDVSVAKLEWKNEHGIYEECIGIRWNSSSRERVDPTKQSGVIPCVGMPTSHGIPVWFILPDEMFEPDSDIGKALYEIEKEWQRETPKQQERIIRITE